MSIVSSSLWWTRKRLTFQAKCFTVSWTYSLEQTFDLILESTILCYILPDSLFDTNWLLTERAVCTENYYTTKLLGGLIQKIHQSDRAIAGLIFSKYQTGSVRIRPEIELFKMADAEEIEVCKLSPRNTKQFLSRRRKTPLWDWFGMWNNLERPEEARWTWKREVITNGSSWASRFYRRT